MLLTAIGSTGLRPARLEPPIATFPTLPYFSDQASFNDSYHTPFLVFLTCHYVPAKSYNIRWIVFESIADT
jgi:hypothetical protein